MKAVGLGSVPVGPLYMSFLTLPIAVGAITMGPAAGAILGGVFGAVSFYDAVTGAFATVAGKLTVPEATFTQNADGSWTVTPGQSILTVTGTV